MVRRGVCLEEYLGAVPAASQEEQQTAETGENAASDTQTAVSRPVVPKVPDMAVV